MGSIFDAGGSGDATSPIGGDLSNLGDVGSIFSAAGLPSTQLLLPSAQQDLLSLSIFNAGGFEDTTAAIGSGLVIIGNSFDASGTSNVGLAPFATEPVIEMGAF